VAIIATYADNDDSSASRTVGATSPGWPVAYIVSRGLAKLGTREPYTDDID
jgi:hypothetical protein